MDRDKITFAQAEGAEPLPSPLKPKEVSQELRAKLWLVVRASMLKDRYSDSAGYGGRPKIIRGWLTILRDWFVFAKHRMVDEFDEQFHVQDAVVKEILGQGDYVELLGFLEFVLRHPSVPYKFADSIGWALAESRAAYRLVDGKTIASVSNEAEEAAVTKAFADLKEAEFGGALEHLRNAAKLLTGGKDADSIRESIHAVESVARLLDPKASAGLHPALVALEKAGYISPILKSGFEKIYGYSNAEKGIRHPMLDEGTPKVDEIDAQFMFGACASFISYLIAKARKAKIEIK